MTQPSHYPNLNILPVNINDTQSNISNLNTQNTEEDTQFQSFPLEHLIETVVEIITERQAPCGSFDPQDLIILRRIRIELNERISNKIIKSNDESVSSILELMGPVIRTGSQNQAFDHAEDQFSLTNQETECPICCNCFDSEINPFQLQCNHKYCSECLSQYLKAKVEAGDDRIICPNPACKFPIAPLQLAELTDAETYHQLETLKRNDSITLICPGIGCGEEISIKDRRKTQKSTKCGNCGTLVCIRCSQPHKPEELCLSHLSNQPTTTERIEVIEDDATTKKWKKKLGIKACPACGAEILRNAGCSWMLCTRCHHGFNWDNSSKSPSESDALFKMPIYAYESLTSREFHSQLESASNTREKVGIVALNTVLWSCVLLVWVPVVLVAGPPVAAYRGSKKVAHEIDRFRLKKAKAKQSIKIL